MPANRGADKASIRELLRQPAVLRKMISANGNILAKYILGLQAPAHFMTWDRVAKDGRKRKLILAPRDHGKTIWWTQVKPIQRIAENRNIRIKICSANATNAVKRLRVISDQLRYNPKLTRLYGPFYSQNTTWRDNQIYVIRDNKMLIDPTVEAIGVDSASTGGRCDLFIFDDIIDDDNCKTEAGRKAMREWFYGTALELLEPDGEVWMIGTLKSFLDLYSDIIENDPMFSLYLYQAIIRWPDKYEYVYGEDEAGRKIATDVIVEGTSEVLWPKKWNIKQLLLKKASMGSYLFNRENQNLISNRDNPLFAYSWFDALRVDTMKFRSKYNWEDPSWKIFQAWDLSVVSDKKTAETKDRDYTVGYTIALDTVTFKRIILDIYRERGLTSDQIKKAIKDRAKQFHPIAIGVENNLFQNVYVQQLRTELPDYRIIPHNTTEQKADPYEGVPILSELIEHAQYDFPTGGSREKELFDAFRDEFVNFGTAKHDDLVLALWILESVLGRYVRKLAAAKGKRQKAQRLGTGRRCIL